GRQSKIAELPPAAYLDLELDPDGRRLAMYRLNVATGNRDIVIHEIGRGGVTPLTSDPGDEYSPRWSPDGAFVAYASISPAGSRLYKTRGRGGVHEQLLDLGNMPGLRLEDWSSDGQTLIYSRTARIHDIWSLPLSEPRQPRPLVVTDYDEKNARLSPNGRWVAYSSNEAGPYQVFIA